MYKFLNKVFGWDYIYWENSAAQGIARVLKSPNGDIYYYRYKITNLIDIIRNPEQVLWLTCKPDKYFSKPLAVG